MTLTVTSTAGDIINRAAVEVGLAPSVDPVGDTDENFRQLTYLLNTAGEELAYSYQWEFLTKTHSFITADTDSGEYPLPDDFLYMIPQSGWERANRVPLFGGLSAQDWTYLKGRKLANNTIYASFRIQQGLFTLFPQPPQNGWDINYEYQSKNWVITDDGGGGTLATDTVTANEDVILFDRILISRYLKQKYLEAKGLDATGAMRDTAQRMSFITNVEKSNEIISAGQGGRGFPYLDTYRNTPDTNYGGSI